MAERSKIEWTENTWNPITGCSKISEGCVNCYAYDLALRPQRMGNEKYANGFKVTLHERTLQEPLKWKKPSLVFVNSMSDLFHETVPIEFIQKVFSVMNKASWHTFQVLTKRADRLLEISQKLNWTPNIWQGVTVENDSNKYRIDYLREVPSEVRFVSFEPLIGEVFDVDLSGVAWAIVGGESGARAREMKPEWVLSLKRQCEEQGIMFYFKQWGGRNKKKTGRIFQGKTWDDMPKLNTK